MTAKTEASNADITSTAREIAFIDGAVSDVEALVAGLRPGIEHVVLEATRPAPAQIADALKARAAFEAVHIIAHGSPGAVEFGAGAISSDSIARHASRTDGSGIPPCADAYSTATPYMPSPSIASRSSDCFSLRRTVRQHMRSTTHLWSGGTA